MDIIVFFKIKDSRRIYEKSQRCMPPPPREISKILISSALAVLLSVSVEASAVTEKDNQITFSASGDTFTPPSGGVYEVTSGEKTIVLNRGVQTATFNGNISASGGKIIFNFNGTGIQDPNERNEGLSVLQFLNFGSYDSSIQASTNGKIDFNFFGTSRELIECYAFDPIKNPTIINRGVINFNLDLHTSVSTPRGGIKNYGAMNFNFKTDSYLSIPYLVNEGELLFDLSNTLEVYMSSNDASSDGVINQNGGTTKIRLSNTKNAGIRGKFSNSTSNKQGLEFEISSNSVAQFSEPTFLNAYIHFKDSGNSIFLDNDFVPQSVQIQWLENQGSNNLISLGGVFFIGNQIVSMDTWGRTEIEGELPPIILRSLYNKLEIGTYGDNTTGISGDTINFLVFVNTQGKGLISNGGTSEIETPVYLGSQDLTDTGEYAYSDRVIIHSSQNNAGGVHNIGIFLSPIDYENIPTISYHNQQSGDVREEGNIAVATVANDSNVTLNALSGSLLGFNLIETSFEKVKTNDQGIIQANSQNNTYTTYFLSSARDMGVAPVTQEVTSSVFALNYDLFLANFNSLNKRMGDLRDNPYSQGAWGRIFNGQLSNDFGLGSQNNYTTLQAGYDYDFGLENARNYLGVAFSYGFSISEMSSNAKDALQSREIKDIFSNSIELALYNAYVSDNGLYSDSIAKFSYLMSDFNLTNNSTTESLSVNNYTLSFSEEVGYVFTLGESKEWSITPQAELGLGYYSSSDLTQVAGEFYLDAKADSLLMLRARVGSMVGYDFKQFTQGKDIQASLYAGLSYEFDYLSGGDIELTPNVGEKTLRESALSSDGRGVLNIGTNLAIKDNTRLYVDFQTSFGGKINTDYQINIGARFSFGEKQEKKMTTLELPLKPTEG